MPASDGKKYTERDFKDGTVVLFVYPKDMTPGCTQEACDFRDAYDDFNRMSVRVFGLSKDSLSSHERFIQKHNLPFPLLSDEKKELLRALHVWKEKKMYGKTYMGGERSTFVISNGRITHEWRKVRVNHHVTDVLAVLCQQ